MAALIVEATAVSSTTPRPRCSYRNKFEVGVRGPPGGTRPLKKPLSHSPVELVRDEIFWPDRSTDWLLSLLPHRDLSQEHPAGIGGRLCGLKWDGWMHCMYPPAPCSKNTSTHKPSRFDLSNSTCEASTLQDPRSWILAAKTQRSPPDFMPLGSVFKHSHPVAPSPPGSQSA
jgi:hypothetical protein